MDVNKLEALTSWQSVEPRWESIRISSFCKTPDWTIKLANRQLHVLKGLVRLVSNSCGISVVCSSLVNP